MEILKARGMLGKRALSEFTVSNLPRGWPWGVFCGVEELVTLLEGKEVNLWGLPEGTVFKARDVNGYRVPVLTIEGPYSEYCIYETPALGFICHSTGVATMAARCKKAAGDRLVIAFGIRRMNPFIAPSLDRASFIGGCDGVSSLLGAEVIGEKPSGTMPHALIIMFGSEEEAFRAFDEIIDKSVPRVALIDTYSDEKFAAIKACHVVKDLFAVRLDTPGSRRGSMEELVKEIRWEMDLRGYGHVRIMVSGGLDEFEITKLREAGVDGFGVGTSISNAPTVDFAMDIVEIDGKPVAKRGKLGGRKTVYRCPGCMEFLVSTPDAGTGACPRCGTDVEQIEVKLLENGRRVFESPSPQQLRKRVMDQLQNLAL